MSKRTYIALEALTALVVGLGYIFALPILAALVR